MSSPSAGETGEDPVLPSIGLLLSHPGPLRARAQPTGSRCDTQEPPHLWSSQTTRSPPTTSRRPSCCAAIESDDFGAVNRPLLQGGRARGNASFRGDPCVTEGSHGTPSTPRARQDSSDRATPSVVETRRVPHVSAGACGGALWSIMHDSSALRATRWLAVPEEATRAPWSSAMLASPNLSDTHSISVIGFARPGSTREQDSGAS